MATPSKPSASSPTLLTIREATNSDLPSLETIFARSFHPVNPFMKHCFPNIPPVRTWWTQTFLEEIRNPDAHPLIAYDASTSTVAGICCLRLMQPTDQSGGMWSCNPFVEEIDVEMFQPALDAMIEGRKRAFPPPPSGEEEEGGAGANFLVELLGVDQAYKGTGAGRLLLERVGEIVDEVGAPAFVEANANAKAFYEKFGFVEEGRMEMPGVDGKPYVEHLLVRAARKR